jgi:hypothetical protein
MDIAGWLSGLGLAKYATTFAKNEITPEVLPHLSDADRKALGRHGKQGSAREPKASFGYPLKVRDVGRPSRTPTAPAYGMSQPRRLVGYSGSG